MIFFIENIFLFFGVFTIALYIWTSKINQKKIVVDHVVLLFFGFFYYFYFPIFSFLNGKFTNKSQIDAFKSLTEQNLQSISIIFLLIVFVTILADLRSKKINSSPTRFGVPNVFTLRLFLILLTTILIPTIIQMLPFMFSEYDSSKWIRGVRGPFLSYIVVLITMSSMFLASRKSIKLINIFSIFAFVFSLINLLSGNRGFFIAFIVSIVVAISQFKGGIRLIHFALFILIGIILAGLIGFGRSSGFQVLNTTDLITLKNLVLFQLVAESGNVLTSLIQYMNAEFVNINLIEFPRSLLSQTINIIPSFIFPSKFDYITIDLRSPYFLASSHFYVLLAVNFGLIGAFLFIYLFVFVLNYIKIKYRLTGIYYALCAYIPFMFFRDFELTVVKFMFEFSFIFAIIVLISGNTLKSIFKK
jgi:hypothetical protein